MSSPHKPEAQGILLVNKPIGQTSFSLVGALRRRLKVKRIGHAGTLDPFASGVMVMLIGREYTKLSNQFLFADKEYLAQVFLGVTTDTYDCDGEIVAKSDKIPTNEELEKALSFFQGEIEQTPPMYSAKKIKGKKLYELARKGIEVERQAVKIKVNTQLISYEYPYAEIKVSCSKGTYIRSIAHDLGKMLETGAHLSKLERIRSGTYHIQDCMDGGLINSPNVDVEALLIQVQK